MTDYLQQIPDSRQPDVAQAFDEVTLWASHCGSLLLDYLKPVKNIQILDVGCGTGFPLFEIAQRFGETCAVVGVDPWEEGMKRAAFKQQVYGVNNVRLITGDLLTADLPDNSFDLITANLVINNFDDPVAGLRACYRLAKPGAKLVLTTNIKGHFAEFYDVYRSVLTALGKTEAVERLNQQENHRHTRAEVGALVEAAGFRVTNSVVESFFYRFADGSALLRHWLVRLGFLDGWRTVLDPADEAQVFSQLEDQLNRLAEQEGDIRLTVPMLLVESQK